jgi:hypothetical protein
MWHTRQLDSNSFDHFRQTDQMEVPFVSSRHNRTNARKSPFELVRRPEIASQRSEDGIQIKEYLLIDSHLPQVLRSGLSGEVLRSIDSAIRAASKCGTYVYNSVKMISDVLGYVDTFLCFTSETTSMKDWDIPAFHPLAPQSVDESRSSCQSMTE